MFMNNKDQVWKLGEEIARKYLEEKGYKIIEQNYRTKYSEIDLIVKKGGVLIFVEVRAKRGELFGSPEDSINKKKLKKIYFNADNYVKIKNYKGQFRIDAVCIVLNLDNSVKRLGHYENII